MGGEGRAEIPEALSSLQAIAMVQIWNSVILKTNTYRWWVGTTKCSRKGRPTVGVRYTQWRGDRKTLGGGRCSVGGIPTWSSALVRRVPPSSVSRVNAASRKTRRRRRSWRLVQTSWDDYMVARKGLVGGPVEVRDDDDNNNNNNTTTAAAAKWSGVCACERLAIGTRNIIMILSPQPRLGQNMKTCCLLHNYNIM